MRALERTKMICATPEAVFAEPGDARFRAGPSARLGCPLGEQSREAVGVERSPTSCYTRGMNLVRPITRHDIKGPQLYAGMRDDYRNRVIAMKQHRRVILGDRVEIVFDNRFILTDRKSVV